MIVTIEINKTREFKLDTDVCKNWPCIVLEYILDYKHGRMAWLQIDIDNYILDVQHLITVLK